jgi:cell wall assembly regulator SMI1
MKKPTKRPGGTFPAPMETTSKRTFIILCAGLTLLTAGILFAYSFDSDRCLARSWDGFIQSIEAHDASATADYLAKDYSDSWG